MILHHTYPPPKSSSKRPDVSYSTKQQTLHLYDTIYRFFIHSNSYPIPLRNIWHSNMDKQLQANSRSQPTAQVVNQDRRRCDVVLVDKARRSVMQLTESGSTHRAHAGSQNSSPPWSVRCLLARPSKRPQRDSLYTVAYNDHEADQDKDGQ